MQRDPARREKHLKNCARYNLWRNVNPHKPDGSTPPALIARVRFKCIELGYDPGDTQGMKMAILEVGYESPELQRGVFHPDYINRTAGQWSWAYRNFPQNVKDRLFERYKLSRVDCS